MCKSLYDHWPRDYGFLKAFKEERGQSLAERSIPARSPAQPKINPKARKESKKASRRLQTTTLRIPPFCPSPWGGRAAAQRETWLVACLWAGRWTTMGEGGSTCIGRPDMCSTTSPTRATSTQTSSTSRPRRRSLHPRSVSSGSSRGSGTRPSNPSSVC